MYRQKKFWLGAALVVGCAAVAVAGLHPIVPLLMLIYGLLLIWLAAHPSNIQSSKARRDALGLMTAIGRDKSNSIINGKIQQGVGLVTGKTPPKSRIRLLPAGAESDERFRNLCDSCMACVEACNHGVLKPAMQLGAGGMQPHLDYAAAYCPPTCNSCTLVCPMGALDPVAIDDKPRLQIGIAEVVKDNCLAVQHKECRACQEACPLDAIEILPNGRANYPVVDHGKCNGCGACQAACKAYPFNAIFVQALPIHRQL